MSEETGGFGSMLASQDFVARPMDFGRDSADVIGFISDTKAHTVDLLRSAVESGHAFVLVAETGGHVIGWTAVRTAYRDDTGWSPDGSTASFVAGANGYLEFFEVAAPLRGRGIGSKLLAATEREALACKKERLWLHTSEENAGACRLYERNGWAHAETLHPRWNGGRATRLYMKDL